MQIAQLQRKESEGGKEHAPGRADDGRSVAGEHEGSVGGARERRRGQISAQSGQPLVKFWGHFGEDLREEELTVELAAGKGKAHGKGRDTTKAATHPIYSTRFTFNNNTNTGEIQSESESNSDSASSSPLPSSSSSISLSDNSACSSSSPSPNASISSSSIRSSSSIIGGWR